MIEAVDDALLQFSTLTHVVVDPQLAQGLNGSNSTVSAGGYRNQGVIDGSNVELVPTRSAPAS